MIDPYDESYVARSALLLRKTKTMQAVYESAVEYTKNFANRRTIYRMKSCDAAHCLEDDAFDFVYVDGDHHYKAVLRDLELYWPKVKSGGLFCGHDYEDRHSTRSVRRSEVKPAVDAFCRDKQLQLTVLEKQIWTVSKP
jgi:predicted O-methyltransferase YrrM